MKNKRSFKDSGVYDEGKIPSKLPTIVFKNRNIYGRNLLASASKEADALFKLMSPRQHLEPSELIHLYEMGHTFEIIGDSYSLDEEMNLLYPEKRTDYFGE